MDLVLPFHEEFYEATPTLFGNHYTDGDHIEVKSPVDDEIMGKVYTSQARHIETTIATIKQKPFTFENLDHITQRVESILCVQFACDIGNNFLRLGPQASKSFWTPCGHFY